MTPIRIAVTLKLRGPILTHASGAGPLGVDAAAATLPDGRCYLPFSLVKGRLRQSWDELGLPDAETWFGRRLGGWKATRGRFRFSDFVEDGAGDPAARRHRVRIDEQTGAADDGMLQTILSPFAPGKEVVFRGEISYYARPGEDPNEIAGQIEQAFRWTTNIGAGRTYGFGRVLDVRVTAMEGPTDALPPLEGVEFDYGIALRDPLCLARRRIAGNLFESDSVIPGAAVRGVAATTLNDVLGRASSDVIDAAVSDPEWKTLATHFNRISISHAFPSHDMHPIVPPLTLVRTSEGGIHDVALQEGPGLIGGEAPQFAVDWKHGAYETMKQQAPWNWPDVDARREIRVRTAIDRGARRAAESQLFAYETIRPDGITWRGRVSFAAVPEEDRAAVVEQFRRLFALEPAAWGKTKARGRLTLAPADARPAAIGEPPWVVTLQTPALLCDPLRLDEQSDGDTLFDAYASAWHAMSNGSVRLIRFFAQQTLAGGYLVHRFRRGEPYEPFVLTDPGSVFVLEPAGAGGPEFIAGIAAGRLPLPPWAVARYGDAWDRNPFLPIDGFGEVAVNLPEHRRPIAGFELIERWKRDWTPPAATAPPPAGRETGDLRTREEDDLTAGAPKPVPFTRRWHITATLETLSELHIGTGDVVTERVTKRNSKAEIEKHDAAAVSTDARGRAYIPGSGIKGALRAWLTRHHPAHATAIARLFGHGGDSDTAAGGVLEVCDASASDVQPPIANVPFWNPDRLTGATAAAAIDRKTRTAQDEKLFHREYVPAGVRFELLLTGDGLSDDEAALVHAALRAFHEDSIRLGAETRGGWGRIACSDVTIRSITAEAWLKDGPWEDRIAVAGRALARAGDANVLRIAIDRLAFTGPFLVNEPSRTKSVLEPPPEGSDLPEPPDHAERVGPDGKAVLPVSSFRGALRSRAEKIVRTLGKQACMATDPRGACRPIDRAANAKDLCIVCQLFGATGWATPIRFEPFTLLNDPKPFRQELVAIDRFTGGVSGSAKFDLQAVWRPEFASALTINLSRWDAADIARHRAAALGLLLLALRDVAQGDVTFGFGAAKGCGACIAEIRWPDDAAALVDAFRTFAGLPADPAPGAVSQPVPAADDPRPTPPAEGGEEFFNPYHFVGVSRSEGPGAIPVADMESAKHLSHAAEAEGTYSGRIVCRLTALTPLVVGAKQHRPENGYATVEPFRDPGTGHPALPATSLRGLVSSIAEAASNSALRVLENTAMSYRCRVEDNLTEIGMIVDGNQLVPLTTTLPAGRRPSSFAALFPDLREPVFVGRYVKAGRDTLGYDPSSFLGRIPRPDSHSPDRRETWYLDRRDPRRGPIGHDAWSRLDAIDRTHYQPGILRILGIEGREQELPVQKAREIFIPVDPSALPPVRLDAPEAIRMFERLAAQRTEADASLPFEVKGSKRNDRGSGPIELRSGDLVFFKAAEDGKRVERLAVSSIWRRATDGDVHAFFGRVSKELLPIHPDRQRISIAEQMFGFVEAGVEHGRALASRVRPSMGVLVSAPGTGPLLPPVPLKILSSPKLPAPAFYFRPENGNGWIAKRDLSTRKHVPRGRKMYLHHSAGWDSEPWRTGHETEDPKQKNLVTPIARGAEFVFHFDFENLTRLELGLLCYALRPAETFRHKLGLGKPIGLGSVKIDPLLLLLKDRDRYRRPWWADASRWDRCESIVAAGLPDEYGGAAALPPPSANDTFAVLRGEFRAAMSGVEPRIIDALEQIGDPRLWQKHPVHTPQLAGKDIERETYQWFVRNDRNNVAHQSLGVLGEGEPEPLRRTIPDRPKPPAPSPRQPVRREPRPPRVEVQPPPPPPVQPTPALQGEEWVRPVLTYDERAHMIIARTDRDLVASCAAEADDPRVLRIKKGDQPERIRVLRMHNGMRTIRSMVWPDGGKG